MTIDEVALRVGISNEMVATWVKQGILPGVQLEDRILVAPEALQRFTKLEAILDALDAERPPATPAKAAEIVRQGRSF